MADNYLEKRMEDYRRGGGRTVVRRPQAGVRFLIVAALDAGAEAVVEKLQKGGCRVAFMEVDHRRGSEFAQRSGSLFIPVKDYDADALAFAVKTVSERWGGVDFIIAAPSSDRSQIADIACDGIAVLSL